MKSVHRRTAFERKLLRRMAQKWGEWEERSHLASHPHAPEGCVQCWVNNKYSVQLIARGELEVLMVRRHDEGDEYPWRDLQRIKNELVGEDREAVQVFPKQGEVVDVADMAHIWLVPVGQPLPYTFANMGE